MSILNTIKNIVSPAPKQPTFNVPFTTRETYLVWRARWKADYKALSAQITQIKRQLRRDNAGLSTEQMSQLQSKHHYLSLKATQMLEQRAEAKVEAARQYAARREEANAA